MIRVLLCSDGEIIYFGDENSFVMTDASPMSNYTFQLRYTTEGDESALSDCVTVKTPESGSVRNVIAKNLHYCFCYFLLAFIPVRKWISALQLLRLKIIKSLTQLNQHLLSSFTVPSSPQCLVCLNRTTSQLKVAWQPPELTNGILLCYHVTVNGPKG